MEGNKRVEPETVRSYLTFSSGDPYDPAKVDDSLKALFATGLFQDVRMRKEGSTLVVTLVENPIVNQVAFEGNKEIEDDTLSTEVQLKPRAVYTRSRVQADVQRILNLYRRQGLYAAQVNPKIINLDNNRIDVVFEINEGPTTKVRAINFIGNSAFSNSQLRFIITTTQTNLLSFLKSTNIYDPDRLNLDRELLRQFYMKNGYADARIISATATSIAMVAASSLLSPSRRGSATASARSISSPTWPPSMSMPSTAISSPAPAGSIMPTRSKRPSRP